MTTLNIKHSGLMGDIIYALPTMRQLMHKLGCENIKIMIPNNKISDSASQIKHIGGSYMFTQPMFNFIKPLLEAQSYIEDVIFMHESDIPKDSIDFDIIRYGLINTGAGNIPNYYTKAFGVTVDLTKPWLEIPEKYNQKTHHPIIIGRSTRYINTSIDYSIISDLGLNIGFIGTDQEFDLFIKDYGNIKVDHLKFISALDYLNYIKCSDLYIGNQSFFFAIAESTKTSRLLESFELVPNVIPYGGVCGQFLTTKGLCMQINEILGTDLICKSSSSPEYHLNNPLVI